MRPFHKSTNNLNMTKVKKLPFTFRYAVQAKKVKNFKTVTATVGTLEITGECSFHSEYSHPDDRYKFTIDSVTPVEQNILDLLDVDDLKNQVDNAVLCHVMGIFHADNLSIQSVPIESSGTYQVTKIIEPVKALITPNLN